MSTTQETDSEWQARLEANRQQLARLTTAFEEEAGLHKPLAASVGDIITRESDDADFAQAMADREANESLVHLLGENREQVERALERLSEGKYGYCEDCDTRIDAERLKFRPESTRCVGCQSRWDRLNRRSA